MPRVTPQRESTTVSRSTRLKKQLHNAVLERQSQSQSQSQQPTPRISTPTPLEIQCDRRLSEDQAASVRQEEEWMVEGIRQREEESQGLGAIRPAIPLETEYNRQLRKEQEEASAQRRERGLIQAINKDEEKERQQLKDVKLAESAEGARQGLGRARATLKPEWSIAARVQAITLRDQGVSMKEIESITGMGRDTVRKVYRRALERGYDPAISRALKDEHVITAIRTGRPRNKVTDDEQRLTSQVEADRAGQELNAKELGFEHEISAATA